MRDGGIRRVEANVSGVLYNESEDLTDGVDLSHVGDLFPRTTMLAISLVTGAAAQGTESRRTRIHVQPQSVVRNFTECGLGERADEDERTRFGCVVFHVRQLDWVSGVTSPRTCQLIPTTNGLIEQFHSYPVISERSMVRCSAVVEVAATKVAPWSGAPLAMFTTPMISASGFSACISSCGRG